MDLGLILIGLLFILIGASVGYFLERKTKLLDNFSKSAKERNKILKDPDLLIEKIKETIKKVNPNAEGDPRIFDDGKQVILSVETKDGEKKLKITKK